MKTFLTSITLIAFVGFVTSADPKEKTTLLIETNAADLAKEFEKNADAAKKRYDPKPPKGATAGGAYVKIGGEVDKADKGGVYLKTDSKVKVYIQTKKLPETGRFVADGSGTFKDFKNNTVTLECKEVEYKRIIGDK